MGRHLTVQIIAIRSGIIEKLEPMDDDMADQGFNLRDLVTKRTYPHLQRGSSCQLKQVLKQEE